MSISRAVHSSPKAKYRTLSEHLIFNPVSSGIKKNTKSEPLTMSSYSTAEDRGEYLVNVVSPVKILPIMDGILYISTAQRPSLP